MRLSKDVEKALGDSADHWKKGMRSRHQGYGIGALGYFRRVVEDSAGKLLQLLADAMAAGGQPADQVQAVRDLIKSPAPFVDKMKQAATMIPRPLRPGGANPFQTIFDVLSTDLHNSTDQQCCALVDALEKSMLMLIATLNEHIEQQKEYGEAVKTVERLKDERKNS